MKIKSVQTQNEIYKLRFDYNAYCKLESLLGIKMTDLSKGFEPSFSDLRIFFLVALESGEKRKFTEEQVGNILTDIMDEYGIEGLAGILAEVIQLSQSGNAHPTGK